MDKTQVDSNKLQTDFNKWAEKVKGREGDGANAPTNTERRIKLLNKKRKTMVDNENDVCNICMHTKPINEFLNKYGKRCKCCLSCRNYCLIRGQEQRKKK